MMYPCCGTLVFTHEHPVMLMAYWLAPVIATAASISYVFIILAPGLMTVCNPCNLQEPVLLECCVLSCESWKCSIEHSCAYTAPPLDGLLLDINVYYLFDYL
jgi:hypothetical protein